jgi:hypothetical protein
MGSGRLGMFNSKAEIVGWTIEVFQPDDVGRCEKQRLYNYKIKIKLISKIYITL